MPEAIAGMAAGRATWRISSNDVLHPSTLPASTKTFGMDRNAVYVAVRMGKKAPTKIMKPAAWVVSPNQMMENGIQASGGMGRKTSMIGSRRKSAVRNHPISIPIGTPRKNAARSPIPKCSRLTVISVRRVPDPMRSTNALMTSVTLGRMNDRPTTYSAMICQITATVTSAVMPRSRFCVCRFMSRFRCSKVFLPGGIVYRSSRYILQYFIDIAAKDTLGGKWWGLVPGYARAFS
ncbi:hypothetical protein DSECCO2_627260 [anaerobic digester metagenome]